MSVFTKIYEARLQVGAISKQSKKGIPYQYQGIEEVMHSFKQVFDSVGLLFLPSNTSVELVGDNWVLSYEMIFVDPDDESTWTSKWGATMPVQEYRKNGPSLIDEKATGKAHSYAVKYFLMKTFMVTDKEDAVSDVDGTPSQPVETAQQLAQRLESNKPAQPANVTPAPQKPAPTDQRLDDVSAISAADAQKFAVEFSKLYSNKKVADGKRYFYLSEMSGRNITSTKDLTHAEGQRAFAILDTFKFVIALMGDMDAWEKHEPELMIKATKKTHEYLWLTSLGEQKRIKEVLKTVALEWKAEQDENLAEAS